MIKTIDTFARAYIEDNHRSITPYAGAGLALSDGRGDGFWPHLQLDPALVRSMQATGLLECDEKWGEWSVTVKGGVELRKIVAKRWLEQ